MALTRSEAREKAMVILYQILLCKKNKINYNIDDIIKNNIDEDNEYIKNIILKVVDNIDEIQSLANKYLISWPLERLGLTDQAIILIAIVELLYTNTPNLVCINEAIELSKKYSDESVTKMINGILDKIYHNELDSKNE